MNKRNILITGAAGCIGKAICKRFLDQGEFVIAVDIDDEGLKKLGEEMPYSKEYLHTLVLDVTNEKLVKEKINELESHHNPISVVVNNAGGNLTSLMRDTTSKEWLADIELNLNAVFYICKAVISHMIIRKSGCIINIGSVNGLTVFGDPGYSAAKAGLINFTKLLATEYGPDGIRTNIVCPGSVKTKAWDSMSQKDPDLFEKFSSLCSLNKIATPDDVAALVRFVASDEASMMNGSTLVIDGGLTAGIPSVMHTFVNI